MNQVESNATQKRGGMGYYQNPSELNALSLRLNTQPILERYEMFLRGQEYDQVENANGTVSLIKRKILKSKANEEGINAIMSYLHNVFNSQVVQGNFNRKDYQKFIKEIHLRYAKLLWINMYDWEIRETDFPLLVMSVRDTLISFLSRTIDNLERDSYKNFMESRETTVQKDKGGLRLPFGNKD